MKASRLIAECREDYLMDQAGQQADRLWTDASLLRRINQAHQEAAYRGLLIRDTDTARICEIPLVSGQAEYRLDKRIIKVNSISLLWTDGRLTPLPALSTGDMELSLGPGWKQEEGQPLAYRPEGHTIRLGRVPSADYVGCKLKLDVYRYPLAILLADYNGRVIETTDAGATSITVDTSENLPELGEDEEIHLTGAGGSIICTGRDGDTLACLPLASTWARGAILTGDNDPELPPSQHHKLLYHVVAMAYLKRDPDVKASVGYHEIYMGKFARAFGPEIDHSQRMHTLQSPGSLRFHSVRYPQFNRRATAGRFI